MKTNRSRTNIETRSFTNCCDVKKTKRHRPEMGPRRTTTRFSAKHSMKEQKHRQLPSTNSLKPNKANGNSRRKNQPSAVEYTRKCVDQKGKRFSSPALTSDGNKPAHSEGSFNRRRHPTAVKTTSSPLSRVDNTGNRKSRRTESVAASISSSSACSSSKIIQSSCDDKKERATKCTLRRQDLVTSKITTRRRKKTEKVNSIKSSKSPAAASLEIVSRSLRTLGGSAVTTSRGFGKTSAEANSIRISPIGSIDTKSTGKSIATRISVRSNSRTVSNKPVTVQSLKKPEFGSISETSLFNCGSRSRASSSTVHTKSLVKSKPVSQRKSKTMDKESGNLASGRPKRRASLEAHSAMVALTLQMQQPITKNPIRKKQRNKDKLQSTVETVLDRVLSPSLSSTVQTTTMGKTSRKLSTLINTISTKSSIRNSKLKKPNRNLNSKSELKRPSTSPKKMLDTPEHNLTSPYQSIRCTCQSPPACPLHYQLHCAYQHQYHYPTATVTSIAGPAITSVGTGGIANNVGSISSVFPFSIASSPSTPVMATTGTGILSQHYPQQQQQGAWPTSAWTFPAAAQVLATLAAPNPATAAVLEASNSAFSGFPAIFQGHLFIGPQLQQSTGDIHLNQTQPTLNPLFVNTAVSPCGADSAINYTHSEHRHPSPPISNCVESTSAEGANSNFDYAIPYDSRISGDMRARNGIYELIQNTADMAPLTLKFAKKENGSKVQKRKSSASSGGGSPKQKRQKRMKKLDADQMITTTTASTSAWEPLGKPIRKWVYLNNDAKPVRRDCYQAIRHKREGEVIQVRDCVVVKSGESNAQNDHNGTSIKRPYVGKVADFFVSPSGGLWASLAWYYWPEQADVTSTDDRFVLDMTHPKELLASRHVDCVAVDSIEDVAYVVTANEYHRYVAENKAESSLYPYPLDENVSRAWNAYPRRRLMPADDTDDGVVYFCRRVYDFHGKRILRNPSF